MVERKTEKKASLYYSVSRILSVGLDIGVFYPMGLLGNRCIVEETRHFFCYKCLIIDY